MNFFRFNFFYIINSKNSTIIKPSQARRKQNFAVIRQEIDNADNKHNSEIKKSTSLKHLMLFCIMHFIFIILSILI